MSDQAFFLAPGRARPPHLPARQRAIRPEVESTLRYWVLNALGREALAINLAEWVSPDSRSVSHVVLITVDDGLRERVAAIEMASARHCGS